MCIKIGSRYKEGFVICKFSSTEFGDEEKNHLILMLIAQSVEEDTVTGNFNLAIFTEIEIVEINNEGEDIGYIELGKKIYSLPFPEDVITRKKILRLAIKHYTDKIKTTPASYWNF